MTAKPKGFLTLASILIFSFTFLFVEFAETRIGKGLKRPRRFLSVAAAPSGEANLVFSPASQIDDFLNQNPQVFTLSNTGGNTATSIAFSLPFEFAWPSLGFGDSVADRFVISATNCTTSLGAGSSCTITVEFRPCEGFCNMQIQDTCDFLSATSDQSNTPSIYVSHSPAGGAAL